MCRGRSGRRRSICSGGVQSGHSRLALTRVAPLQANPSRPTAIAVAKRLAVAEQEIKPPLARVDHDGAGPLVARIAHGGARDRGAAEAEEARDRVVAGDGLIGCASQKSKSGTGYGAGRKEI